MFLRHGREELVVRAGKGREIVGVVRHVEGKNCLVLVLFCFFCRQKKKRGPMNDLLNTLSKAPYWDPTDIVQLRSRGQLTKAAFQRTIDFLRTFSEWDSEGQHQTVLYEYKTSNGATLTTDARHNPCPLQYRKTVVNESVLPVTNQDGVDEFVVLHCREEPVDECDVPLFVHRVETCRITDCQTFVYNDFSYYMQTERFASTLKGAEGSAPSYYVCIEQRNPSKRVRTPSILAKSLIMKGQSVFPTAIVAT